MLRFEFTITIAGYSESETPEEAWTDACEEFALDNGPCPEIYTEEIIKD